MLGALLLLCLLGGSMLGASDAWCWRMPLPCLSRANYGVLSVENVVVRSLMRCGQENPPVSTTVYTTLVAGSLSQ